MPLPNPPGQQYVAPFQTKANGLGIAATSTATTAVPLPMGAGTLRVLNEGPNTVFLAFGSAGSILATVPSTTATQKTCDGVMGGEDVVFTLDPNDTYVSAICRSAQSATITLYPGTGQ